MSDPVLNANSQSFQGVQYEFAPNKTHILDFESHQAHQVCNVWGGVVLSTISIPLGQVSKKIWEVAGYCIPFLAPPQNAPGHKVRYIGRPINWIWQNPLKSAFLSSISALVMTYYHLERCLGEHLYTIRSYLHTSGDRKNLLFSESEFAKYKLAQESGIGNLPHLPDHTFIYLNESFYQAFKERVINDPIFAAMQKNKSNYSFAFQSKFDELMKKHQTNLLKEEHPHLFHDEL